MVTEISHLSCDPGVNSERWPLVTCEAFLKHHKDQQEELPVCAILNGNVEEINVAKKTINALDRVTYLSVFRGHSDTCRSAGRIQLRFLSGVAFLAGGT